MKKWSIAQVVTGLCLPVVAIALIWLPPHVHAQLAIGAQPSSTIATSLAGCQTATSGFLLCPVFPASGQAFLAMSVAGYQSGAPFEVGPLAAGGSVTSWNGRTGAVTPAQGDYSYAQLSSPPTTLSCGTWAISQSGALTASGCTIK